MNFREESLKSACKGLSGSSRPPDPFLLVLFGASGDLAHRKLVPSLHALAAKELLPERWAIVGFALREWDDGAFRSGMREAVLQARGAEPRDWNEFARRMSYIAGDFTAEEAYERLRRTVDEARKAHGLPDNLLFHLAAPPRFYCEIIRRLAEVGLLEADGGWRRVVLEKPFGRDEAGARELDCRLLEVLEEEQVYRVDHFLGKETVQNLLVFRFANPAYEPIWNRNFIDHVQVTAAEDGGIGSRADYYEGAGAIRDMVQNHLLQLLSIAAMEPPVRYDADSLRDETAKVLRAVRPIDLSRTVLGQYGAGRLREEEVRAYRRENGVREDSTTPTFAAAEFWIDNWRWEGVPFYLRTGKRLERKTTQITIQFRRTPRRMFPLHPAEREDDPASQANVLTFRLQPDEGIVHTFLAKQPGPEICLRPVTMVFRYDRAFGVEDPPSAYEWLILDAIQGEQTLFPRSDWIRRAWSIVDPWIERSEAKPSAGLPNYSAGSWGPEEAEELLHGAGRKWRLA